jgi:hypothetical protein
MTLVACVALDQNQDDHDLSLSEVILEKVRHTDRISSNHYSSMVVDSSGHVYISCFYKHEEDGRDRIFIVKLDDKGRIIWEEGGDSRGRATDISRGPDGSIFVTGIFNDTLSIGGKTIVRDRSHGFVARLDENGQALDLKVGGPDIFPTDISVNDVGQVLVAGTLAGSINWDGVSEKLEREIRASFLLFMDSLMTARRVQVLTGEVSDTESLDTSFVITGYFNKSLGFAGKEAKTSSSYDQDGFVAMASLDKDIWLQTFGQKGYINPAYRTHERGVLLEIQDKDIYLTAVKDPANDGLLATEVDPKLSDAYIMTYSSRGDLLDEHIIASDVSGSSIHTLAVGERGDIWISGTLAKGIHHCGNLIKSKKDQVYLLRITDDPNCPDIAFFDHGQNTLIRDMAIHHNKLIAVGHVQAHLAVDSSSILPDDRHTLFFLSTKVE